GQTQGRDLRNLTTPFGRPRFELSNGKLIQNSMVEPKLSWVVKQVRDTINPNSPDYNSKSALAKTIRFADETGESFAWGDVPSEGRECAHSIGNMSCVACHSSWNPSCFGCHLPQRAAKKRPDLHNEGDITRNLTSYNFQTLRDDVFMLAKDGLVTGQKINPARSSCAIHVTSYNLNREVIYSQQQTISGEGMSGVAFSTNVPHTVRGRGETKSCTDCHVSAANDNNAQMAQLLMLGTNATNFMGRYCWTAAGSGGLMASEVTELDEPQAVIGSSLHEKAYPDRYREHLERQCELPNQHQHKPGDIWDTITHADKEFEILSVQQRGEYVYAACGAGGIKLFDTAFIENKGFSQRIATARFSPLGQRLSLKTKYATSILAPTTMAPDPTRIQYPENHEQPVHGLFAYLYVTDLYEGVILIGAGTLLDGNPSNNFLERALTFNPNGILNGARNMTFVGHYGYICCDAGLVVVSFEDPLKPKVTSVLGNDVLNCPTAVQAQFRYGFVCDAEGLSVLDLTNLETPQLVTKLSVPCAKNIYVARTYAYIAGGPQGLIIVNVENPEQPVIDQVFNAEGQINDLHDVKLAMTNVSQFAYLADGANGLRVVQLTSPETPGNYGFSPRPTPRLIATAPLEKGGCAVAISEALDRDRAVDETGHQLAVFGRVGARPFNLQEQQRFFLRPNGTTWTVIDEPDPGFYGSPRPWKKNPRVNGK
ncbi:MAG: hypothetical protein FJ267_02505, partial [Planctomycetes bacterium]|nr:hypothetical protein [Planctomycetota bacterium]